MLAALTDPPPRAPPDMFDEHFYLAAYPDIRAAVQAGHFPSGRHHYQAFGEAEGRDSCGVDRSWYCRTYPIAALELGQGDTPSPLSHWLDLGRFRGYKCQKS